MLYKITVYEVNGKKTTEIYTIEVTAKDVENAVNTACIRLGPGRICQIKEVDSRLPKVNRIERDAVI